MSKRADRVDAAIWGAAGAVILVASLRIDRLETMGINPWSMPGLTPIVVGGLMMIVALALGLGRDDVAPPAAAATPGTASEAATGAESGTESGAEPAQDPGQLQGLPAAAITAAICIAFAGLTLGRGLPFSLEAAVFITIFTSVFSWREWRTRGRVLAGLATTVVIAVVAAVFIAWLFESIFLVRLP